MSQAHTERAWGWVSHLREGGTTPWSRWRQSAPATGLLLPGAQHLELLRRLNLAQSPSGSTRTDLSDRVLSAAASGRGRADLPLVGITASPWGPRPVDPEQLPPVELLRIAASLLAEDVVAASVEPEPEPLGKPWRRRHRLIGDPIVVGQHNAALKARGRPQGGPLPHVVVAAGPLDELLAHTWTRRCFEHGSTPWVPWLRYWQGRDQLPWRADLPRAIAQWTKRSSQVRIVTDHSQLARELGVRRLSPVRVPGADAAELARRIAPLVGLLVPAPQRPALLSGTLLGAMPASSIAPVVVPASEREWIERAAERLIHQLRRAGYPVVGDLADITPRFDAAEAPQGPELEQAVLDLAVRMLVDRSLTQGRRTQ